MRKHPLVGPTSSSTATNCHRDIKVKVNNNKKGYIHGRAHSPVLRTTLGVCRVGTTQSNLLYSTTGKHGKKESRPRPACYAVHMIPQHQNLQTGACAERGFTNNRFLRQGPTNERTSDNDEKKKKKKRFRCLLLSPSRSRGERTRFLTSMCIAGTMQVELAETRWDSRPLND